MKKIIATLKSVWAEYGAEALRTTLSAMIPAVFIALNWDINYAIPFVIGALNASMTDFPGHRREKVYVAMWNIFCAITTVLLVGYSLAYTYFLIVLVGVLAGVFTLMGALGPRMMMVGVTSLFMITFVIGLRPSDIGSFALCAGLGTAWFYFINLLHHAIDPLWEANRVISNGYRYTVVLLRIKALCYDASEALDRIDQRVAEVSIKLADQHETIRHLLLRKFQHKRLAKREYQLWLKGYVLMDLYSLTTAIDRDYLDIREKLAEVGLLDKVKDLVYLTAELVELVGGAVSKPESYFSVIEDKVEHVLFALEEARPSLDLDVGEILDGAIVNARSFLLSINRLRDDKGDELIQQFYDRSVDIKSFLPVIPSGWNSILQHIRLRTPLFIFACRMSLLFFIGVLLGELLSDMKYTYWILMTLIVVARPSYSLTTVRNRQRILGTIGGIVLGTAFIFLISNVYVLLFFVAFLLFSFLLFNRKIYMVSVFFITASVVIALHLHEDNWIEVLTSRFAFTLIGSALAFIGWYVVPIKHQERVGELVKQAVRENQFFYDAVRAFFQIRDSDSQSKMRAARKQAFLAMTKLSDTIIQLQKEPGHTAEQVKLLARQQHVIYRLHAMISNVGISDSFFQDNNVILLKYSRIESIFEDLNKVAFEKS